MTRQIFRIAAVALVALSASICSAFVAPSTGRSAWGCSSVQEQRPTASFALSATRDPLVMMPGTLDREKTSKGPAVLERPDTKVDEPTKQRNRQGGEAWEVRIYNDGMNTREHVARSLVQVTGMSEINAYQTMMQAHQNGIAVVGRWVFEVAEMYHERLKSNGIICDIVPVDEDK